MKNSRRNFIIIEAVLALLAAAVTALMLQGQNRENREKIAVIVQDSDDSQWTALKYGLKMAAKDAGVEVSIVTTGSGLTAKEVQQLMEDEIEQGARGLLVQPVEGQKERDIKIDKRIPVMLLESGIGRQDSREELPVVQPDHYACGRDLAKELLEDCNHSLQGKTLGIFCSMEESQASEERRQGFCETIRDAGGQISWFASPVSGDTGQEAEEILQAQPWVDYVIALDDNSLTAAGEASAKRNLHGALVYGIGNSTEAVYYLDTRAVECLIVPDEFNVGYQGLTELVKGLHGMFYTLENQTISHTVLRRQNLFSQENQELLFTMSQ